MINYGTTNPANPTSPQVSVNVGGANGGYNPQSYMTPEEQRQYDEYQEFLNSDFFTPIKEAKDELVAKEKEAFLNWRDSLNPQSGRLNDLNDKVNTLTEQNKVLCEQNEEFKSLIKEFILTNKGGTNAQGTVHETDSGM